MIYEEATEDVAVQTSINLETVPTINSDEIPPISNDERSVTPDQDVAA